MEPAPNTMAGQMIGTLSNDGIKRYLLEAESTTGFVAWKTADGTTLVSQSMEVSLAPTPSLSFWPCAGYQDTTPAGQIISFDCHGNALTHLDVRGLTGLQYLDASFNQLWELPLDGLTNLECLDADSNQLVNLDCRGLGALRVLSCAGNQLRMLNLSGLADLQILDYSGNPITTLRVQGCRSLPEVTGSPKPAASQSV